MTAKRVAAPASDAPKIVRFPDPRPCDLDMSTYHYVNFPAYPSALADHLGNLDTSVILSETAAGLRPTESYDDILFPDLLIALNVNAAAARARNGYLIPEQGKAPDFVLEVASDTTYERDEGYKRDAYAAMGVAEYWRFDHTGGWYQTPLAGDALVEGRYQPIPVHRTEEGHYRGHSLVLNLTLCWEDGLFRLWDPTGQRYLTTDLEERAARRQAEADREEERAARRPAEADREEERAARRRAEARIRQLEEELHQPLDP